MNKTTMELFHAVIDGISLIPEVTQEGLLKPYTSYADVTLFHYHVPEEVSQITWEFAAFMDDASCVVRDVLIILQHGSYPLISTYNGTFPIYMYSQRSSLYQVVVSSAYQPVNATVLPVYNPLPGSWFAAAYVPNWTEEMQQEGIIHKCHYSLGSIAMWDQEDNIQTLHVGSAHIVHVVTNIAYFRFYVPSHTWLLHVNISDCKILEHPSASENEKVVPRWCIRSLGFRARALPFLDLENGISNITETDSHLFVEPRPFSDSYYYILVYTEECWGLLRNPPFHFTKVRRSVQNIEFSNSTIDESLLHQPNVSIKISVIPPTNETFNSTDNNFATEIEGVLDEDDEHKCFPILPLARIKHARDFTDTFLIQGLEWYSTWLSIKGESPIYTHMTLLPYTDIGGTLRVSLHMDELIMNATVQIVSVIGCLRKGRPPMFTGGYIECESDLIINATTLSHDSIEDFLVIPFPEPDIWYLAVYTACFYNGIRSPCLIDRVMVSLDIQTQPCVAVAEQPCSNHGMCRETHRGMFFFSSCSCQEGWRGWGCHDGADANAYSSAVFGICFLTLSNLFFLPPIALAFHRKLYSQALLFLATMIASVLYHICDNEVYTYCIARFEVLQFTDFFFSLLCFWVTIVGVAGTSVEWTPVLHILGVIIIAPTVEVSRTALASFTLPMGVAATIPVLFLFLQRWLYGQWPKLHPSRCIQRLVGALLALFGLLIFALMQNKDNYKYVHSFWHIIIALSLIFLLPLPEKKNSILENFNINSGSSAHNTSEIISSVMTSNDDDDLINVEMSALDYAQHSGDTQVTDDVDFIMLDDNYGSHRSLVLR